MLPLGGAAIGLPWCGGAVHLPVVVSVGPSFPRGLRHSVGKAEVADLLEQRMYLGAVGSATGARNP